MTQYISTKEFRLRLSTVAEDLKKAGEIIVLKKSKPLFKIIPFEDVPSDILDRANSLIDNGQPDLNEIAQIVHNLRKL
jgi:antitoxin (DNA-binding transcriptional repressor) of toxin-antitoxin stability system